MIESSPSEERMSHGSWIVVAVVVLLAVIAGLILWLNKGPSVISAGHRWAMYPSTGKIETDGSSEQEELAFDGNVKLISLLYTEHVEDQGEQIREALCHVLIDLPRGGVMQTMGGGASDGVVYRRMKCVIRNEDKEAPLEKLIELRFRLSDRSLTVHIDDANSRVVTDAGSVLVVRLGDDGQIRGVNQIAERVSHVLGAADVARLLGEANAD